MTTEAAEVLARALHAGQEEPVGRSHVGRRGDLRMVQFHARCHCQEEAERIAAILAALSQEDRLLIAGVTEERLLAALLATRPVMTTIRVGDGPVHHYPADRERDEARAILAALTEDPR